MTLNQVNIVQTSRKLTSWLASPEELFEYKSQKVILTLFNALIRPHLEYCIQFWSPYYKKDIDKLERIQRKVNQALRTSKGAELIQFIQT